MSKKVILPARLGAECVLEKDNGEKITEDAVVFHTINYGKDRITVEFIKGK